MDRRRSLSASVYHRLIFLQLCGRAALDESGEYGFEVIELDPSDDDALEQDTYGCGGRKADIALLDLRESKAGEEIGVRCHSAILDKTS